MQILECESRFWSAKADFGVRKADFGVRQQVSECESASQGKPENFFCRPFGPDHFFSLKSQPENFFCEVFLPPP